MKKIFYFLLLLLTLPSAWAQTPATTMPQGPSLDCTIKYYNRTLSAEGVLRESHYTDKMLRRPGHVWAFRVLPEHPDVSNTHDEHIHAHFNHVLVPRHISFDGKQTAIEFIDTPEKQVISIERPEYENVGFDGSWLNAYFLVDPAFVAQMPLSDRTSPTPKAHWHEIEKNGIFQRILWDDEKMIPIIAEAGDHKNTFFNRVEVQVQTDLRKDLPWTNVKNFTQKVYADFLD